MTLLQKTLGYEENVKNILCPGKKRPKCFCNIFYRTQTIFMKFGTWFPQ